MLSAFKYDANNAIKIAEKARSKIRSDKHPERGQIRKTHVSLDEYGDGIEDDFTAVDLL